MMVFKSSYKTKSEWLNDRLALSVLGASFLYPLLLIPLVALLTDLEFERTFIIAYAYGFAFLIGGMLNLFLGSLCICLLAYFNKNQLWHWLLTGSIVGTLLLGPFVLIGDGFASIWGNISFVMLGALSGCCLAFFTWWFMSPHKFNPERPESNSVDPRKRGVGPMALFPPIIIVSLLAWAEYKSKAQYEQALAKKYQWLDQINLPDFLPVPSQPLTLKMSGPDYPPLTEWCAWELNSPWRGKRPRQHRLRVISWGDGHAEIYGAEYAPGCTSALTHQYEAPGDYLVRFYYADLYADWFPLTRDFDYPWMNELSAIAEETITVR